MTMPDLYAWRCSPEFSAAILARQTEQRAFLADVWLPWDKAHPETRIAVSRDVFSLDDQVVGFIQADRAAKITGLSNSKARGHAIPSRGKTGDPWQIELMTLRAMPSLDAVFKEFEVPTYVLSGNRVCSTGVEHAPEGVAYLACKGDLLGKREIPAVTRCTLVEFYGVREACQAAREAKAAGHG